MQIEGIGEEVANSIVSYFNSDKAREIIKKLKQAGVKAESNCKRREQHTKWI